MGFHATVLLLEHQAEYATQWCCHWTAIEYYDGWAERVLALLNNTVLDTQQLELKPKSCTGAGFSFCARQVTKCRARQDSEKWAIKFQNDPTSVRDQLRKHQCGA